MIVFDKSLFIYQFKEYFSRFWKRRGDRERVVSIRFYDIFFYEQVWNEKMGFRKFFSIFPYFTYEKNRDKICWFLLNLNEFFLLEKFQKIRRSDKDLKNQFLSWIHPFFILPKFQFFFFTKIFSFQKFFFPEVREYETSKIDSQKNFFVG